MGQKMTTVFYHISTWLDGILNFKDFFFNVLCPGRAPLQSKHVAGSALVQTKNTIPGPGTNKKCKPYSQFLALILYRDIDSSSTFKRQSGSLKSCCCILKHGYKF
jgi:hypothetical protein